ncbi:MAG: branched-chain amino acid transport system substrate-binding protein [Rhodospirillaceae bacterium]|jgi:branched-chain amino acid transport system substrate-binding protein|nr:branched-chain amino acid transport system substrate-binding protein [Rhodospirillaceae bacterium]
MRKFSLPLVAAAAFATAIGVSAARAENINVAVAGPITGEYAAFGEQMKHGAQRAVADINAKGGVLGKILALNIGDDQCDPKQAVAVANNFASKGVVFVAGHFCSGSSIPASSVYHEEGILQITPASTNPKFTEDPAAKGWGTVFRTCGRDDQQGSFAGPWIAEHYKGKNVAVIDDKSTYGKGLADLTREAMNKAGLTEVVHDEITAGEKDYSALVSKLKAANVDVIYFGGYHPEAALIVKQSRDQGLNAQLLSGDSLNTQEYATLAGTASDGTMFTNAAEARNLPTAKAVVEEFRNTDKYEPEGYTLSTYAAVQVWAQAVEKAKSTDPVKVAETIRSQPWDTVIGKLSFDPKGDLTSSTYVWYVFKGGKYAEAGM